MYILNLKKKSKGSVGIFMVGLMIIMILLLITSSVFFEYIRSVLSQGIQDDLILSNSSVYKCIDIHALGDDTPQLQINDYNAAFAEVKKHIIKNMNLDQNMNPKNNTLIGKVDITEFTIYNFKNDHIDVIRYENGRFLTETKATGTQVFTSNKHKVDSTVVTTTIEMDVKDVLGTSKRESVSVDTDIVLSN